MNSKDLLLEIGVEELPASFVTHALAALPELTAKLLDGERLSHGAVETLGTPRRLSLIVRDVAERQTDLAEEVLGPPARIAFDAEGAATKAALGFAKKQGVAPEALYRVETDKGEYVAFKREEAGQEALSVLPGVLGNLVGRVPFPKSMRWGAGEVAFGRPIHWLVALHGEAVVDFEFASVRSGRDSRGHRFLSPARFDVTDVSTYVDRLRAAHVVVSVEERRQAMERALLAAADEMGGSLVDDDFLLGECTSLVEEPHVVPGSFDEVYLALPPEVVVSVMRDHQRYFAIRTPDSEALLPRYLNVVNTANEPDLIAKGNDRVLRARLEDARFFVEEDQKVPLADRIPRLDAVVFQKALGSIGDKVRRLMRLAPTLLDDTDAGKQARRAAELCKADLITLIVGEFPELQGEMGRFYALAGGVPHAVADAIAEHYLPRGKSDDVPTSAIAAAVAVADRADTLVGCFGIGLVPSGSADPFALRRAALSIVRIALEGPIDVDLRALFGKAHAGYVDVELGSADAVNERLDEFVRARLRAHLASDHPSDLVDACLAAWDGRSVRDLAARVSALSGFRDRPQWDSLAVAFKRAHNIAKDAPPGAFEVGLASEPAETSLAAVWAELETQLGTAVAERRYQDALTLLATRVKEPIDRFFEEVFVMVDDEAIRDNRLRLLSSISSSVNGIARFDQLSLAIEGAEEQPTTGEVEDRS